MVTLTLQNIALTTSLQKLSSMDEGKKLFFRQLTYIHYTHIQLFMHTYIHSCIPSNIHRPTSWGCEGGCRRFCHFSGGPLQQPARRSAGVPLIRTPVGAQCRRKAHL